MGITRVFRVLMLVITAALAACDNQSAGAAGATTHTAGVAAPQAGQARAAEVVGADLGVAIYPGARQDEGTTAFIREAGLQGTAFRTSDKLSQVVDFYKSQPGFKVMGVISSEGAMFSAPCMEEHSEGCDISVTIQSPWLHMTTNEMMGDTLITIGKNTAE